MNKKKLRKRLFVDPGVQGALIARVVMYWVFCMIGICFIRATLSAALRATNVDVGPWTVPLLPELLATLFFVPIVVHDILKTSNRFVGPVFRIRRCMRELAQGKEVAPLHFRDGDLWQDVATDFNGVLARVQRAEWPNCETSDVDENDGFDAVETEEELHVGGGV